MHRPMGRAGCVGAWLNPFWMLWIFWPKIVPRLNPVQPNLVSGFDEDGFAANYNFQIPTDDLEAEEGIVPLVEEGAENSGKMQCLKCFMTFSHLSSAKRHYRNRHLNSEKAICKFCKRILKNKESLDEHVRTIHGISKKQLKNRIVPNLWRTNQN